MLTSSKVDMSIIIVSHRRLTVYHLYHTAFASHSLEQIPKRYVGIGSQLLLIAYQALYTRHGAQLARLRTVFTVAYTNYQN